MKKKYSLGALISIMFVAMTLTFCVTMVLSTKIFENKLESVSEKEAMYDKIADIDSVVRQNFYTDINDEDVLEALSAGYADGLGDSETRYLSAEEVIEYQEEQSGQVIGIGLDFVKSKENNGYLLVTGVADGSPAELAGIKTGDTISAIGGTTTIGMSYKTAEDMLSGVSGDSVDVTYIEDGKENTVTLVHKAYDITTVTQQMIDSYGYIKISTFAERTTSDLDYAINSLTSQGMKVLIIDLRGNSSKDFDTAAECADLILAEGTSMNAVYKDGDVTQLYKSDKNCIDTPVVVLVNGSTGYAAEMFAVMMRDSHDAKIVGVTTMGKGTLQKLYRLSDGSGIELTVASLSPVKSDAYNGTGVAPDYEKTLDSDTEEHLYEMALTEDPQIVRAMEVAGYLAGVNTTDEETETTDESSSEDTASSEAADESSEETDAEEDTDSEEDASSEETSD